MKIKPREIEFDYYSMLSIYPVNPKLCISNFVRSHGFVAGNKEKKRGYAYIEWDTEKELNDLLRLLESAGKEITDCIKESE